MDIVGEIRSEYHALQASNLEQDFLLDPFTYSYMNSTYSRNHNTPVSYEGKHSVDVLTGKALGLLAEAVASKNPFFLGIAPVAPHADIWSPAFKHGNHSDIRDVTFSPPVPAERHANLFQGVTVPRTSNFNPDQPSGASWIRTLPQQSQENLDYNDHFYRQRLRALQSVDELVDRVVRQLEQDGILNNTYIIYTSDNGYHIGQHRLQPAKQCSFEEDINIPMIIRGPQVPAKMETDIVTTHTDLAPTFLRIAGAPMRDDFDGLVIPLTEDGIYQASLSRHEHVTVEHWGFASNEGKIFAGYQKLYLNNTYKAVRVIGETYNLHYQVWCNNERELYDLAADPGQMDNLLHPDRRMPARLLGTTLERVVSRLDSLLFILKSCKTETCIRPWDALHQAGNVGNLQDALSPRFDNFYMQTQAKVRFDRCEMGFILDAEGPQFEQHEVTLELDPNWHEWT